MSRSDEERHRAASGVLYAVLAYGSWGFIPVLWKQLVALPALVLVADRVITSFVFVGVVLTLQRRWPEVLAAVRDRRTMGVLALSALMISANWLVYLWAVTNGQVMQGSLGYFINPLVNIFLARLFLGESLRPLQWIGVGLAVAGVVLLTVLVGSLPWIALVLAGTFAAYGLLRRRARVEALTGLAIETALALPIAVVYLAWQGSRGVALLGESAWEQLCASLAGVATALPLWWFALGAQRLRFSTLGVLQFISPTGQFLLAWLLYGEPFDASRAAAFGLIWLAILAYCVDAVRSFPHSSKSRPR